MTLQITQTLSKQICPASDLGWGIFFGVIIGVVLTIVMFTYLEEKV